MKIIFLAMLISSPALAATHYACAYTYMGAPMTNLEFDQIDADHLSVKIKVAMTGTGFHDESLTPDPLAPTHKIHAWISKESAENQIELIVYKTATDKGDTEIINHHMPAAFQEVWGKCTASYSSDYTINDSTDFDDSDEAPGFK